MFNFSKTNFSSLYLTESRLGMNTTKAENKNNSINSIILNDQTKRSTNLVKKIKNYGLNKNNERERLNKSKEEILESKIIIKKNEF